eukprot:Pompholyxophrys_sp_v1_NODE_209_length_1166_cov_1.971197.p2 type:complete len:145 gc:universal NODE_209_length_1166_cov_1.971197:1050-616(-)
MDEFKIEINGTLTAAVLHRLKKDSIFLFNVVSFGSDGASVMSGKYQGVTARLLNKNCYMFAFRCVCHRQSLACKAAADEVAYFRNTFFPTIEQLGRHCEDSTFLKVQEDLGLTPLKVVRSAFTAWLSHGRVVEWKPCIQDFWQF